MANSFLRWLIPGVVVVLGGSAAALALTEGPLATDLETKSVAALTGDEFGWASVAIDGRDAVISGTATTQQAIDDAIVRVGAVPGVRAVHSETVLAEIVSPFPFGATIESGKVTLSGGYPSESIHALLLADAAGATDNTRLLSGAPDQAAFVSAARFGLDALQQLDAGQVQLADLSLSITGRARSPEALDALSAMAKTVPAGVQLAALQVTPALASPFVWTAHFDGKSVAISGNTPSANLAARLRAETPDGIAISTSLVLASGEPAGFEDKVLALFKTLLQLEQGDVTLSDDSATLTGAPETSAIADQVTATVAALGGTATLEPPRVAAFALAIGKRAGALTFTGFAPDAPTRARLAAVPGGDASALALGRGAPVQFDAGVDFGLAVLAHLGEGTVELNGDQLSIAGRADTVADFTAAAAIVAGGVPQGLSLAAADIHPPVANPFTFSAVKGDDGKIALAGFIPNETVRTTLHAGIASLGADKADPADGAPANFAASAAKGLEILALLDTGKLAFDGTTWSIDGFVSDTKKGFAADAAFSIAGLRTAGWTYSVHLPPPAATAALPIIAPYAWHAAKAADGSMSFTGFVPAEAFQTVARNRAPGVSDSTVLGAGAPADFATSALAGLDALMSLDEGSLGLSGNRWTLTGTTGDLARRKTIQDTLSAKIDPANWQIAIQARDATPVVTPYLWSAEKGSDGAVKLSGYLPSDDLRSFAAAHAGTVERDDSSVASGEPAGFADDLLAGLNALSHLSEGKAQFDGSRWILTGSAASQADGDAAVAALAKGTRGGTLWTMAINGYSPPGAPSSSSSMASEVSSSSAPETVSESSSAMPVASAEPMPSSAPADASSAQSSSAPGPSSAAVEPGSAELTVSSSASEPAPSSEPSSASFPETPFMEPKPESSAQASPESSSEAPAVASSSSQEPAAAAAVEPSSSAEPQPTNLVVTPPMPDNLVFEASRARNAPIALKGAVPAAAAAAYFGSIAGGVPTDALVVTPGMPVAFITDALGGLDALGRLVEGRLGFDGSRWWLRGKAEAAAVKDGVAATVAALPGGAAWSVAIDLLSPIDICSDKVAAVAGRNAILFKSGSATIVPDSMPILDELAADLEICPNTYVHVEGHTDGDGPEDVNLALSVARAEAVVAELIARGVGEERLYAEGYGESKPVAPNDTKQGKAQNRRIAFTISPE